MSGIITETVKFRRVNDRATVPHYSTEFAAGADLYACLENEIIINPGETVKITTGICLEIPAGLGGFIFARSGLATKSGLAPANKVGVVDSDYRGEIIVALHNHSEKPACVKSGDRVAQIVFLPYVKGIFLDGDLSETERGTGGFGSTGS